MYKKLIVNTLIYGLAPQISRVLSIVILPFITPYLTPYDYGVFGIAIAVTSALSVFSNFGLNYILMLYFYKASMQYKWMWRQIYGFLKIWMIVFAMIQVFFLYVFLPEETNSNFWLIALLFSCPFFLFSASAFIGTNFYRLKEMAVPIGIRTVVVGVVSVCLNFLTIKYFNLGYIGWFFSLCFADVLSNILYYFPLHYKYKITPIYNFKINTIKLVLKKSLPLIPHYYSIYLLDLSDRLVMKVLKIPINTIGNYNVVANFGSYFSAFHMAVGQAIGPNIFRSIKENNHTEANKLIKWYMLLTLFLTISFSVWCKELLFFLIKNDDLLTYYTWAIVIVMAYNYRPYYVLINQYLAYNEQVKYLPFLTFFPGILNLILNFILMPFLGIKTAIFTTFFCYMIMGFVAFFIPKIRKSLITNYYPLLVLSLIITSTCLAYAAVDSGVFIKLLCNVGLLVLSYIVLFNKFKMTMRWK